MHILSSLADVAHPCFRPEIDVAIPVHVSPDTTRLLSRRPRRYDDDDDENRRWLAHFQGSVEWFDHDPDYSKGIRQRLEMLYANDPDFHIGRGKVSTYASDMRNSTFCLCPPGFAPWSPRMYVLLSIIFKRIPSPQQRKIYIYIPTQVRSCSGGLYTRDSDRSCQVTV